MATITGTAALSSADAAITAAGSHGIPGVGGLVSGEAVLSAVGEICHVGTGNLSSQTASLSGLGDIDHGGDCVLVSGEASLVAVGGLPNVGRLIAFPAGVAATGDVERVGVGVLVSGVVILAATGGLPNVGRLIAFPAGVAATGDIDHAGTGALSSQAASLAAIGDHGHQGTVSAASRRAKSNPYGTVGHNWIPESGADLGTSSGWDAGWIPVSGADLGTSVRFSVSWRPSSGAALGTSAVLRSSWEEEQETSMPTGDPEPRPLMPITVYFLTAKDHVDVGDVPANRWFVCSPYLGAGDDFADDGALPNWIGQRAVDEEGAVTYPLRPPYDKEVIWFVPENKLYRYETLETGEQRWLQYASMPERGLDGQYFAQLYDPDAILAYWARILGAAQWRLSQDNRDLLDLGDPDRCPIRTIDALAGNAGIIFAFEDTIPQRRARLRSAVTTYRRKGTPSSVAVSLRLAGYLGYAEEIWVEPDDPSNRLSPVNNAWGYPSSSAEGALADLTKFAASPAPSATWASGIVYAVGALVLPTVSNGCFYIATVGGTSGGTEPVWGTTVNGETPDNGVTWVCQQYTGLVRLRSHGEQHDPMVEPPGFRFYLTSRVVIHLNTLGGAPIPYASMTADEIQALHDRIFLLLRYDVLPAHVDIRGFGTDAEIGLCVGGAIPHTPSTEGIAIGETLSVDSFAGLVSGVATMVATGNVT